MNSLRNVRRLVLTTVMAGLIATPAVADETRSAAAALDASAATQASETFKAMSLATEIVDKGYPEDQRETLFFGTMDQTVEQLRSAIQPSLPENDEGAVAIFDAWVAKYTEESKTVLRKHIPAIMTGMVEAYAKIFTVEELTDILAFVDTPSGKKFFELSPAVMGEPGFAEANQRYLDESLEMLVPAQDDLLGQLSDYMDEKQAQTTEFDS